MLFAFNVGAQVHVNEVGSADVDSITIIDAIDVPRYNSNVVADNLPSVKNSIIIVIINK